MGLTTGLMVLATGTSFVGAGGDPLVRRLWRGCRSIASGNAHATTEEQEGQEGQEGCENETQV